MTRYPTRPGVPSENGWPMVNAGSCVSVQVVPAAKKVPLLRGDVATILNAFIILYDRRVEKITSQVWGWSPDNDVWNSNHMSGTAIDIHAPKYPWGHRTMPTQIKQKVQALLLDFEGVIFWGANWSYPDEMHFQIGVGPNDQRVKKLAAKLNNGHLGVWPKGTNTSGSNVTVTKRDEQALILDQLLGYPYTDMPGWSQLANLSLVDAVATIGNKLGIPGFKDMTK